MAERLPAEDASVTFCFILTKKLDIFNVLLKISQNLQVIWKSELTIVVILRCDEQ